MKGGIGNGHGFDAAASAGIAAAFVAARRQARALPAFPGPVPPDLEAAYGVQDLAIADWHDAVVGWKVGYIQPALRDRSGDDRLLGPIFAAQVWTADGGVAPLPVFTGGFGAVEAEFVLRLQADAPTRKIDWSIEEALALPASLHIGIEVASSPLATINALGPCVVASDFGNNNGLLMGPEITDWRSLDQAGLMAETFIEGASVGTGGALVLPGGLGAAFAFALSRSTRRGRPLRAGELVATGNATGIHDILPGQSTRIVFAGHGELAARAVAATPVDGAA